MHRVDPRKQANWDDHLPAGATFFHTAAWVRVLAESYAYNPIYWITGDAPTTSILPMMEVCSAVTGRRGVSLPFTDAVPPIGVAPVEDLVGEILANGRQWRWKTVQFRGGMPFGETAVPSARHLEHSLDLSPEPEDLFANLEGSVRRAVRKAEAAGVEARIEYGTDALNAFCRLNALTRREHGLPPQPDVFFRNVRRIVLDHDAGFVVIARINGRPVAASMFFHFGGNAVFKYGASDKRFQSLRANNLVMWHGILACREAGCHRLSLGRTEPGNEGLLRFKRGWGTVETALNYYTYSFDRNKLITDPDRLTGRHNTLFRWLPLPLLRLAGTLLYRHIA